MIASPTPTLPDLYEADETAWLEAMAVLAGQRRFAEFDCENLAEFLAAMAERDRREVRSRLTALILHLLKWQFQPAKRSRSWQRTIEQHRQKLRQVFASRTLRNHAEAVLSDAYADSKKLATIETGLPESAFPAKCPYSLAQVERDLATDQLDGSE